MNSCRITANKRPRHRNQGLNTYVLSHKPEIQIPVLDKILIYPTQYLPPEGLMLDLDRCMLVDHRASEGMKTYAGKMCSKWPCLL